MSGGRSREIIPAERNSKEVFQYGFHSMNKRGINAESANVHLFAFSKVFLGLYLLFGFSK